MLFNAYLNILIIIEIMKKSLIILCIINSFFICAQVCTFSPFNVALSDDSGSDTNIRNEPNGDIVLKLNKIDEFVLHATDYKDGWFKINYISSVHYGYDITNLNGWTHQSTIGLWTRKKINLLDVPETGTSLGSIDGENGPVKIKDICSNWAKIEFEGLSGWVEIEWLCGNPVTTCP